jgi:putative membrane protein
MTQTAAARTGPQPAYSTTRCRRISGPRCRAISAAWVGVAALAAAGCPAERYEATPDTTRAGGESRPGPRDTAAVFSPVSDADVRLLMALINSSEISAGRVAAQKGIVNDVRSFASDMVTDHAAMQQAVGVDTAVRAGTTPAGRARADTLRRVSARQADSLAALPRGAAFDRAYIDQQLSAHSMALDSLVRWEARSRDPALKAVVRAAVPKVQAHLDRARVIQATLGGVIRPAHRAGADTSPRTVPASDTTRG